MSVLVAYGSKRGGAAGLADMVPDALRQEGFAAEVAPARTVRSVADYEAVVVGAALYAFRWHRGAKRLVRRHAQELRGRPVYLFSSGLLDDSATQREIPPSRACNLRSAGRVTPSA